MSNRNEDPITIQTEQISDVAANPITYAASGIKERQVDLDLDAAAQRATDAERRRWRNAAWIGGSVVLGLAIGALIYRNWPLERERSWPERIQRRVSRHFH